MPESLESLGSEVERLRRALEAVTVAVATVTERTGEHHDSILELAAAVQDLAGPGGTPPRVTSWIDMAVDEQDQATGRLAELAAWLQVVYLRYPDAADLPSCWAWHPDVVEELWTLYHCHTVAYYSRGGAWSKVADWHDRLRPGVVRRIAASVGTCELARHRLGGDLADSAPPRTPLAEHLHTVTAAWAERREAPVPTPEALADARSHDRGRPPW